MGSQRRTKFGGEENGLGHCTVQGVKRKLKPGSQLDERDVGAIGGDCIAVAVQSQWAAASFWMDT